LDGPLHHAALGDGWPSEPGTSERGHSQTMRLSDFKKGADVKCADEKHSQSVLCMAAAKGQVESVRDSYQFGRERELNESLGGKRPLISASSHGFSQDQDAEATVRAAAS